MQQTTIVVDGNDFEVLKREVSSRYGLGAILNVENLSSIMVGDYNHVVFHGYDRILSAMVMIVPSGERFEVKIFPKTIEEV